jgi:hypothetical protein
VIPEVSIWTASQDYATLVDHSLLFPIEGAPPAPTRRRACQPQAANTQAEGSTATTKTLTALAAMKGYTFGGRDQGLGTH